MEPEQKAWDFFIAHAAADSSVAEQLYDLLAAKSRVFLDLRSLTLGDDWDTELRRAQHHSLVTVVLVSSQTEKAYYQRDEIAEAITLARADADKRRVVPVFLDSQAKKNASLPYGLRIKQGLVLSDELTLKTLAEQLLELLSRLTIQAAHGRERVSETADLNSNRPASQLVPHGFSEDPTDVTASEHQPPTLRLPERDSRSTHSAPRPAATLFLCYRRDDTADAAGRLYDRLVDAYGSDRVFMDIDSVPLGIDFVNHVAEQIAKCRVVIVMIGRQWQKTKDKRRRRRLDNPDDLVRVEIAAALRQGVPVIPVLVQDADMPSAEDLPDDIRPLTRRNGIELSATRWRTDVEQLIRQLDPVMKN
jgi:hypothetical protein